MTTLEKVLIVLAAIAAMEWVAWGAHKYIMHGPGWGWHRDHHEPHNNVLEKNDLFGLVGTVLAITMFTVGFYYSEPLWWSAVGVTAYGAIYTFIHDGLVHQRFFRWVPKRGYAKRLVQAHKLHHATASKEGGVSFGFVLARDPATLKAELKQQLREGRASLREAID
jgi:beta-carotene 3-hydroxylase